VADPEGMPASPLFRHERGLLMRDCTQRDQLVREWNETVLKLSKAVSRLKACNGDNRNRFAKQFEETELTRQDAENARIILGIHRSDHGC
jgi:hypothetical protein